MSDHFQGGGQFLDFLPDQPLVEELMAIGPQRNLVAAPIRQRWWAGKRKTASRTMPARM
jgi:hypothetical protein